MIGVVIGDYIEDRAHQVFHIEMIHANGDVKARDNQNRVWYIGRMELNNQYKLVSR